MSTENDLATYFERYADAFAASDTLAAFALAVNGGDIETPGPAKLCAYLAGKGWENYFTTIKEHGYLAKALAFPKAHKVKDLFTSADIVGMSKGAQTREERASLLDGRAFVSALRADGFAFFGYMGAVYKWSPDWLARGEYVGHISKGEHVATYVRPVKALREWWGETDEQARQLGEWSLATIEAVRWDDGRTLIIGRSDNGFMNRWLAVLDAGETVYSLMSDHERGECEAERERKAAAFTRPIDKEQAAAIWSGWDAGQRAHYHMWSYDSRMAFIGREGVETGNRAHRDAVDVMLLDLSRAAPKPVEA